jgi:hypothetical protein
MEPDPLEDLLDLEEKLYNEGYTLGLCDGTQAGYSEGAIFAVEKGYEKLFELGKLYGKTLVWTHRLATSMMTMTATASHQIAEGVVTIEPTSREEANVQDQHQSAGSSIFHFAPTSLCESMPPLPVTTAPGSRLEKNIRGLLSLLDPATLSLENTEDSITEIEERMKNAILKVKLIQRILGERDDAAPTSTKDGDLSSNIEDMGMLKIRY